LLFTHLIRAQKDSSSISLKSTATFGEWNDILEVEVYGPKDANGLTIDLSNKILDAKLYLEKGLSPSVDAPGGYNFYVKTGSAWAWGVNKIWHNFSPYNTWIDVTFDTTAPDPTDVSPSFDPAHPVQLGFELMSGGGGTAGAFGAPLETVIYIDDITARGLDRAGARALLGGGVPSTPFRLRSGFTVPP
jgi:hypothetical protein